MCLMCVCVPVFVCVYWCVFENGIVCACVYACVCVCVFENGIVCVCVCAAESESKRE